MLSRNTLIRVGLATATIALALLGLFLLILALAESGPRAFGLALAVVAPLAGGVGWLDRALFRRFAGPLGDPEETRRAAFTAAACLGFLSALYAVFADAVFDHLYRAEGIGPTRTAGVTAPLAAAVAWGFLALAVGLAARELAGSHRAGRWEMVLAALFLYAPVGMGFAALYRAIPQSLAAASGPRRAGLDAVVFSFTTLSTTGASDLAAAGTWAKLLALAEQFAGGYVLLGLFVAGSLGLPADARRPPRGQPTPPTTGVLRADDV